MPHSSLTFGLLHLPREDLADLAHVPVRFRKRRAFRRDVAVVEGEEGHVEQAEHLEGDVGLEPRRLHRIAMCIHGRMKVSPPNGSLPGQAKECQ